MLACLFIDMVAVVVFVVAFVVFVAVFLTRVVLFPIALECVARAVVSLANKKVVCVVVDVLQRGG